MNITLYVVGFAAIISAVAYLFFRLYRKNKALYKAEIEKNKTLAEEMDKLKKLEKFKDDTRRETENRIAQVDSLNGVDRFNAINNQLSNN